MRAFSCAHLLPCTQELSTPPDPPRPLAALHSGAPASSPLAQNVLFMGHALVRSYVVSWLQPVCSPCSCHCSRGFPDPHQASSSRSRGVAQPPRAAADPPDAPYDPFIGDALRLPADFAGGLCCWIVRLPGLISAARGGLLSRCSPASLADIPEPVSSFLEAILADHPRVQRCHPPGRHVRPAASPMPRPAPLPLCAGRGSRTTASFLPLRPMLTASPDVPSHSLAFLTTRNHLGPCRRLFAHHRDSRLMREWGVPALAPPACIVFGRIESGLARRAQRSSPLAPCDPPPSLPDSYIYSDGRLPTLATGRSNHPRFLDPPAFLSTQSLLSVFGFRFSDRLARALLRIHPGRAQEAICRGVDLHVSRPLIHLLRTYAQSPSGLAFERSHAVHTLVLTPKSLKCSHVLTLSPL